MTLHLREPVAITGARGFIGQRLAAILTLQGVDVRCWSRPEVDLQDPFSVLAAVNRDLPRTVFHLASAGVSSARANDPAVIFADLQMMRCLLSSLHKETRLIYAGSMSEYGKAGILAEADRCTPSTAYAVAKLAAGSLGAAYFPQKNVTFCHARLFGVFGPNEAPQRLFPFLLRSLEQKKPVSSLSLKHGINL